MDIPSNMRDFANSGNENLFSALIKPAPLMTKDKKKDLNNVFMDFDLDAGQITFITQPYAGAMRDEQRYNYFGNNQAAARQVYAVRDVGSILNFWFGKPKGILANVYDLIAEGKLKSLLCECKKLGLFDDLGICVQKIKFNEAIDKNKIEILRDKSNKGIYYDGEKLSADKFLSNCLAIDSKCKFVLIIPRIIEAGMEYPISTDASYIEGITKSLQGETVGATAVCHICGKEKNDINTKEYTAKLSKSSIAKVFVTTTINYSPNFNKNNYQQNYSLCKSCYEQLMFGEKAVMRDFRLRAAGEDCILLLGGITEPLETEFLPVLKNEVDAAFNLKKISEEERQLKQEMKFQKVADYQYNLVFYRSDGKSSVITKTIENVMRMHFNRIQQIFAAVKNQFGELLPNFALGHVYRMIPVSVNNKGEQLDVGRVLDLYSGILKGELIDKNVIFGFAAEALAKGLKELAATKIRNYRNLYQLENFKNLGDGVLGKDLYILAMMMMYIALIEVLQKLNILNEEVFEMPEVREEDTTLLEEVQECEIFLAAHGFNDVQRGLFYIGALMHQIGIVQSRQNHKTKPILDKLTYSGMTSKDVLEFYLSLLEKSRQYKAILWLIGFEQVDKQVHKYLGVLDNLSVLSDQENVFYIMAGYAFCIKNWNRKDKENSEKKADKGVDENGSSKE